MTLETATKLIFTVDVEGKKGVCELDEQLHLVRNGVNCGLSKILDVADANNIKLTFFVDVYEIKKTFGTQPVRSLTSYIFDRGHDVQLHTHPGPFFNYTRSRMWQFSQEEQEKIIAAGAELIHEWTGYYPEAHRAGAYSANKDTISALTRRGFRLDSSYFFKHQNCRLQDDFSYYNDLYQMGAILQLPVTFYEIYERPRVGRQFFNPIISQKKIDIDDCALFELKEAIRNAVKMQYSAVTIFMHSFSLVKDDGAADVGDIVKLEKLMRWVRENKLATSTTKELMANTGFKKGSCEQKEILRVSTEISLIAYLLKWGRRRVSGL